MSEDQGTPGPSGSHGAQERHAQHDETEAEHAETGRAGAEYGESGLSEPPSLAALLRGHRQAAGLTQRELAERAEVSVGAVRDAEQGRTNVPRSESLLKLARALGLGDEATQHLEYAARRQRFGSGVEASTQGSATRAADADRGHWLGILGPLQLSRDGSPIRLREHRQRTILGLLALTPNTPVHRDELIDAVWGSDPPATAASLTQDHVSSLRRLLEATGAAPDSARTGFGPGAVQLPTNTHRSARTDDPSGVLVSANAHYTLRLGEDELDLLAFEQLIAEARRAETRADVAAACLLYEQATMLWRGEPLADWSAGRGHPRIVALNRTRATAVCDYADTAFRSGKHLQVLPHLEQLTVRDPLNEAAHARLMLALAGTGQQAAAIAVFEDIRQRLDQQLGIRPGAELSEVHVLVLRQQVPLAKREYEHVHGVTMAAATEHIPPPPSPSPLPTPSRPTSPPAERIVPRQLPNIPRHFCGRTDELSALTDALDQASDANPRRGAVAIATVHGPAGIGKTSLAVAWAHQATDRFPDGQLYADLRGFDPAGTPEAAPADVIRRFLDAFATPPERIPPDLDGQTALYRSLLADRRVLIVLDNAASAEQIRPLLPGTSSCAVIVTSRRRLTGLVVALGAVPLPLGYFREWEARDLLAQLLDHERVATEPDAVDALIELCAGLPLALSIVANRAAVHARSPLAALVAELRQAASRLDALSTEDAVTNPRAALSWSYRKLSADEARMFRLLGRHPSSDLSVGAAASLADVPPRRARELLGELVRMHLVEEPSPGRYTMHDLLRAYAREEAESSDAESSLREAIGRLLDHYLHTAHTAALLLNPARSPLRLDRPRAGVVPEQPTDYEQALAWFQAEHKTLISAIALAAESGFDAHAWQLPWTLTTFQNRLGHFRAWAWCQQTALVAARRTADLAAQADALRNLGRAAVRLRTYSEALDHLMEALELYRRLADRSGEADVQLELARVFDRTDRFTDALGHALLALDLYQEASNATGPAYALNAAGWYCTKLGHFHAALDYCQRALDLHLRLGDAAALADTWDSLGYVHHHLSHTIEAVDCYEHAAELYAQIGARHDLAATLERIGDSREAAGQSAAARAAWRRALLLLSGLDHPDADRVRRKLADPIVARARITRRA